jgi:1,4-dihydroxy-2-naphthoate octaprenyltransferase
VLFFGIVPVTMTYYLVIPEAMQTLTTECLLLSVACGLVVDTLLVVNNVRDIDNDRRTGKRTLIVAMGRRQGQVLFFFLGFAAVILGCFLPYYEHHWATWLPIILYQPLHVVTFVEMWKIGQGTALNRILGKTARNIFIYGLAVSIGLLLPNP